MDSYSSSVVDFSIARKRGKIVGITVSGVTFSVAIARADTTRKSSFYAVSAETDRNEAIGISENIRFFGNANHGTSLALIGSGGCERENNPSLERKGIA